MSWPQWQGAAMGQPPGVIQSSVLPNTIINPAPNRAPQYSQEQWSQMQQQNWQQWAQWQQQFQQWQQQYGAEVQTEK